MGATDSKIAFRKGIFRLSQDRNLAATDEYWMSLWNVPDSADDIFSLFTAQDIRRIRDQAPENFYLLFDKLYERIAIIKMSPVFTPPAADTAPAASSELGSGIPAVPPTPQVVQATTKQLLNCIRLLTRFIPFTFEPRKADTETGGTPPPPIAEDLFWTLRGKSAKTFGERLVYTVLDLLFLADFTVPRAASDPPARTNFYIWESGIGQTQLVPTSKEHVFHRLEVTRLLLCLLSQAMYTPPGEILTQANPALACLAYHPDKKVVLTLLCSLINTAMKYKSVGWGIPYKMKPAHDPHDLLAVYCLQTLLILFNVAERRNGSSATADNGNSGRLTNDAKITESSSSPVSRRGSDTATTSGLHAIPFTTVGDVNLFHGYVARLHRNGDFAFLASNIGRILGQLMRNRASYFQLGNRAQHTIIQETMMFLWTLLRVNMKFTTFLINSEEFLPIFGAITFFAWDNKADPLFIGQVRMAVFLLHVFSEEPRCGERLNGTFDQSVLPTAMRIPAAQVTYADALIYAFYSLVTTTKKLHVALHPTMLIVLRNVAPYLEHLSGFASDKLVRLLVIFASPAYFLAGEGNYRLLLFTLETINYLIYYQLPSNMQFLYALIRANDAVRKLAGFDFDTGLVEFREASQVREQRTLAHLSDKARGKLPEGGGEQPSSLTSPLPPSGRTDSPTSHRPSASSLEPPATPGTDGRSFQPTAEWFQSWYPKLPLAALITLLDATVPYVEEQLASNPLQSDAQVLVILRSQAFRQRIPNLSADPETGATAPEAPPIAVRHLRWSNPLSAWYRGLLWSRIYVAGTAPLGLWNGTAIQLFQVRSQ
ncbi:hypothetical protein IWQ60_007816 [Tieghemiomyces parasiticus]|uniref:High-temperature-induced dauer-formation protein-domain-containing protein n=1 Tax=Tieghemiomyces parasiticus TaxID=78921 RepID=A0A9W8A0I1_9FUNG|nr:hypothetical protein IWQ60_007816 [Tieghemiomyces parasiticus]